MLWVIDLDNDTRVEGRDGASVLPLLNQVLMEKGLPCVNRNDLYNISHCCRHARKDEQFVKDAYGQRVARVFTHIQIKRVKQPSNKKQDTTI